MTFFKFDDQKSKKQAAVAVLYLIDTKTQNAINRANFYAARSRTTEARVEFDVEPIPARTT